MNVDDERTMGLAEVKHFATCLEELSCDTLKQLVQSSGAYALEGLSELDRKVLKVNGFPSCTVDLPSLFGMQTFPSETVRQASNANDDDDVSQTTKRAILDDESRIVPYDTTKQRILDYYSSVNADEDIQTERLKVTLTCPLSKSRIRVPSRSRLCVHLQCFDLDNFRRSNAKREKPKCPICGVETDFDKLVVDEYFQVVLSVTDEADATEVELLHNGGFRFPMPVSFSEHLPSSDAVITLSDDDCAEDGEIVDEEPDTHRHGHRYVGHHQRSAGKETVGSPLGAQRRTERNFVAVAYDTSVIRGQMTYTCRICTKRYRSKATLYEHLSALHVPRSGAYFCGTCGEDFVAEVIRDNHEDVAHGPKVFRCEICGKEFSSRSGRRQHMSSAKGHSAKPQSSPAVNRAVSDPVMADVLQAANDIERTVFAGTRASHEPARMPSNVRMPMFHPFYRPPPALLYPNYAIPPFNHAAAMTAHYANPRSYMPLAPIAYGFPPPQGPPIFPPNPFVYHP